MLDNVSVPSFWGDSNHHNNIIKRNDSMNDEIAFVQFIHPGVECLPSKRSDSDIIPWNRGIHRRKFLCQPGWYVRNGRLVHDELTFWGEWEPQSRMTRIDNPIGNGGPHVIHHPLLDLDEPKRDAQRRCRQNTDPFVFHEQFFVSLLPASHCDRPNATGTPASRKHRAVRVEGEQSVCH